MKLLIIGSLLFSGGGAVAMQNEAVNEEVTARYTQVKAAVLKQRLKRNLLQEVKETGFPYPCEEFLTTLSEEQQVAILTEIDFINATYDWPNMTDDEIQEALIVSKTSLDTLYEELGVERATLNEYRKGFNEERLVNLRDNGFGYPSEENLADLSEEQVIAIKAKIDEFNVTYDWANMTDDEIRDALQTVKNEMQVLRDELGIERPEGFGERIRNRIRNRIQNNQQQRSEEGTNSRNRNGGKNRGGSEYDNNQITPPIETEENPVNGDDIV
jgi:hypothetical protein